MTARSRTKGLTTTTQPVLPVDRSSKVSQQHNENGPFLPHVQTKRKKNHHHCCGSLWRRVCQWRRGWLLWRRQGGYWLAIFLLLLVWQGSNGRSWWIDTNTHHDTTQMRPSSGSFSTYQENQNNQTAVEAATTTRTNAMISLFQDVVLPLSCQGKEPLLELMWHAKTHDEEDSPILDQDNHNEQQQQQTKKMLLAMADEWCPQLTGTWNQVTDLYGHDVRVVGLETCPTRPSSSSQPPPSQLRMQPRVAGLFHTGTNAVARLLHRNYGTNTTNTSDLIVWEVPWGKHCPYARRHDCRSTNHNKDNQDENNILPIVLVRDPLRWMRKLVRAYVTGLEYRTRHHDSGFQKDSTDRRSCRTTCVSPNHGDTFVVVDHCFS